MPNKPKRRTGRRSHHNAKLSPEAREQKARTDLTGGHFRDAITGFKELLKLEQRQTGSPPLPMPTPVAAASSPPRAW